MSFFSPLHSLPGIFTPRPSSDLATETPRIAPASPTSPIGHDALAANFKSSTFPLDARSAPQGLQDDATAQDDIVQREWSHPSAIDGENMDVKRRVEDLRKIFLPASMEPNMLFELFGNEKQTVGEDDPSLNVVRESAADEPQGSSSISQGREYPLHATWVNNIRSRSLLLLKQDFLWVAVTIIKAPRGGLTCYGCKAEFTFPRARAWRLHGCGHFYHVSCFRELLLKDANDRDVGLLESDEQEQNCFSCHALRSSAQCLRTAEIRARIRRLENNLLP